MIHSVNPSGKPHGWSRPMVFRTFLGSMSRGLEGVPSTGVADNEGVATVSALLGSRWDDLEGRGIGTSHPPSDVSRRVGVSPGSRSRSMTDPM